MGRPIPINIHGRGDSGRSIAESKKDLQKIVHQTKHKVCVKNEYLIHDGTAKRR